MRVSVAKRRLWPDLGLAKGREHLAVKQFVPELRIEALAVAIPPGTVRLDEQSLQADPAKPVPDHLGDELGAVARPDVLEWPVLDEQVSRALQHIVRHRAPLHHRGADCGAGSLEVGRQRHKYGVPRPAVASARAQRTLVCGKSSVFSLKCFLQIESYSQRPNWPEL